MPNELRSPCTYFITTWGTLGAIEVVALVVFVIVLPAVVTALVLGSTSAFAVVVLLL